MNQLSDIQIKEIIEGFNKVSFEGNETKEIETENFMFVVKQNVYVYAAYSEKDNSWSEGSYITSVLYGCYFNQKKGETEDFTKEQLYQIENYLN